MRGFGVFFRARQKRRPPRFVSFESAVLDQGVSFGRNSSGTYFDSTETLQTAGANAPRFSYDPNTLAFAGLLLEPSRTCSIRNNTMIGAVPGTPGTMPTYWGSALGGLTRTVVGTGVYNGIPYADIRFNGTTTGTFANITLDTIGAIPAANGQTWTTVSYIAIVGGALTNITSIRQRAALYDGVVAYLGELVGTPADISGSLTATLARQAATTGTIASATTATINPYIQLSFSSGVAIDITLRIGLPDLEQAASASLPILTSGAAATRAAETITIGNLGEQGFIENGSWLAEFLLMDGTRPTQSGTVTGGQAVLSGAYTSPVRNVLLKPI